MTKGWKFIISGLWVLTYPPLPQPKIFHEMNSYLIIIYCSPAWLLFVCLSSCPSVICLFTLSLCILFRDGICWFWIATLFSGVFDGTGRYGIGLVALFYPV